MNVANMIRGAKFAAVVMAALAIAGYAFSHPLGRVRSVHA